MTLIESIWHLGKHSALQWYEDSVPRFSAALAYYTFFSLAPLLAITLAVAGIFFDRDASEGRVQQELEAFMGPDTAKAVQGVVREAWKPGQSFLTIALSGVVLLFGAMGVLTELRGALNHIWRVKGPSSVKTVVLTQTKLIGFVLGVGFLLVVSLVFSSMVSALGEVYGVLLPWPEALLHAIDFVVEWLMIIFVFAALFKWLPDARVAWMDVWRGAAVTAFLFLAGKFVLSLYLGKSGITSVYGAAGSLIVILLWVYYSAFIFYFGAEFIKVYANTYGSHKGRVRK